MSITAVQIRLAVATAASDVGALLVTVTHEAKTGTDSDGKPTYATGVERQAFVERKHLKLTWPTGQEIVYAPVVLFLENVTIGVLDRITLDDGDVAPVHSVESVADPAGGVYFARAICGRPERGALTS